MREQLCHGGGAERHDFLVEQLLQLFTADIVFMQIKLEKLGIKWRRDRFIIRIMLQVSHISQRAYQIAD